MNGRCYICEASEGLTIFLYPTGLCWGRTPLCTPCIDGILKKAKSMTPYDRKHGSLLYKGKTVRGSLIEELEKKF